MLCLEIVLGEIKLYSWLWFNKNGNLRGFSSGFDRNKAKTLIMKDLEENLIVIKVENFQKVPSKFLEGYYCKTSKNNDLQEFLTKI
mgnify:CR=1 FL=1